MNRPTLFASACAVLLVFAIGCATAPAATFAPSPESQPANAASAAPPALQIVAVESFLADIAQNVAGDRVQIETLMPLGADPHSFEPTPQDIKKVADSNVIIANGAGFEVFLERLLENAGGERTVIEASQGLEMREVGEGEPAHEQEHEDEEQHEEEEHHEGDPHFWLNPLNVVRYTENIRDGLTALDPAGAEIYKSNTEAYIEKLNALDAEIQAQVETIPAANRKLVTDHDTFGYFADHYGFEVIGMLIPSYTTADSSTAQQLAALVDNIKATGVKAILLENNANPQLAEQIEQDTGVEIVTGLYTHSLSEPNGPAPTYIEMMEYDAGRIVEALR